MTKPSVKLAALAALLLLAGTTGVFAQANIFSEGTTPRPTDTEQRSLVKAVDLLNQMRTLGIPTAVTTPTLTTFSSEAVSSTPVLVGTAGARTIYGLKFTNPTAAAVFVHTYDAATAGAVTVGTTTQKTVYEVPANGQTWLARNGLAHGSYTNGIVVAVTTGPLSTSTTAPASAIIVELGYN